MTILQRIADKRASNVVCTDDSLIGDLMDVRTISAPLAWCVGKPAAAHHPANLRRRLRHPLASIARRPQHRGLVAWGTGAKGIVKTSLHCNFGKSNNKASA